MCVCSTVGERAMHLLEFAPICLGIITQWVVLLYSNVFVFSCMGVCLRERLRH